LPAESESAPKEFDVLDSFCQYPQKTHRENGEKSSNTAKSVPRFEHVEPMPHRRKVQNARILSREASARRNRRTKPPRKKVILFRLDGDLLDYFKSQSPDYKRHINLVLRSYMQQDARHKRKKRA
jgi:uncharacterized protein (DUF4415 family)